MDSSTDLILQRLSKIPDVDHMTGTFVTMDGPLAVVNLGDQSVRIPCIGFTPPVSGIAVQVERRNGQLGVFGPAVALPATGTIKATGSPKCTVTVAGVDYVLGYQSSYTPTIGDTVEINWASGIIQGDITVTPDTGGGANPGAGGGSYSGLLVPAADSGQYRDRWQSNDVRASDTVSGAWFYGSRIVDALRGSTPTLVEIYLPLISQVGACFITVHTSPSKPAGFVTVGGLDALPNRAGWVQLGIGYATFLRDNIGGIAVTSGDGDNQWTGTDHDKLSGALRFSGNR